MEGVEIGSVLEHHLGPLLEKGYRAYIELRKDAAEVGSITGGDPGCNHPKFYDPSDGHGYTNVHMDDVPDEIIDDSDDAADCGIKMLEWMVAEVSRREGKPRI